MSRQGGASLAHKEALESAFYLMARVLRDLPISLQGIVVVVR